MNDIIVDVVCPIYKGFNYLEDLYKSFYDQKNIKINKVVFPITDSEDDEMGRILKFVNDNHINYFVVKKSEFSHSLTRQKAIIDYCESSIVVMISQDIKLLNDVVFYNLVKDIYDRKSSYNYARQICTNKSIEKYIRRKNYSADSFFVSKDDIERLQLMAFFASDACSAYDRDIFISLGGYGGYNVMMNEDQLYSKIILDAGFKKKYCADAVVEHSHKYKLKQLFRRYYEAGKFYSEVKVFDDYKSTDSGLKLALYVFKEALKHFDIPVLFRWLPDMTARYLGMKKGRKGNKK